MTCLNSRLFSMAHKASWSGSYSSFRKHLEMFLTTRQVLCGRQPQRASNNPHLLYFMALGYLSLPFECGAYWSFLIVVYQEVKECHFWDCDSKDCGFCLGFSFEGSQPPFVIMRGPLEKTLISLTSSQWGPMPPSNYHVSRPEADSFPAKPGDDCTPDPMLDCSFARDTAQI